MFPRITFRSCGTSSRLVRRSHGYWVTRRFCILSSWPIPSHFVREGLPAPTPHSCASCGTLRSRTFCPHGQYEAGEEDRPGRVDLDEQCNKEQKGTEQGQRGPGEGYVHGALCRPAAESQLRPGECTSGMPLNSSI